MPTIYMYYMHVQVMFVLYVWAIGVYWTCDNMWFRAILIMGRNCLVSPANLPGNLFYVFPISSEFCCCQPIIRCSGQSVNHKFSPVRPVNNTHRLDYICLPVRVISRTCQNTTCHVPTSTVSSLLPKTATNLIPLMNYGLIRLTTVAMPLIWCN